MKKFIRFPNNGGNSKASSSTLCQKCLKKGHYSYECKATTQERPYVSRPSRTQQLLNPKLIPKLSNEAPHDILVKKGIADQQLAKFEEERGRKREINSREFLRGPNQKRTRSISSSSVSVSTISTRLSLSPKPPPEKVSTSQNTHNRSRSEKYSSSTRDRSSYYKLSSYPSKRKKNRRSSSSNASSASDDNRILSSNSTRKRNLSFSSSSRDKNNRSKSPFTSQNFRNMDIHGNFKGSLAYINKSSKEDEEISLKREKSLSPFSKRLALTKAMNMNR